MEKVLNKQHLENLESLQINNDVKDGLRTNMICFQRVMNHQRILSKKLNQLKILMSVYII